MNLRANIITNSVSVVILLILYFASRAKTLRDRPEDKLFSIMVFGVMLGSIMEALTYVIDGRTFTGARILNYILNTFIYSANMLLPFFLMIYVDICFYGKIERIMKYYKPQIIVGIIMIAMNVVNFFFPISYVITKANVYERRWFSYAYYAVILFYFISIFVMMQQYKKRHGARVFYKIGIFVVPVIIGTGLQFLFYGLSLAWLSSAIGLVGLFMVQQNEMAYIDPLVNTYNRQYLDHILSSWLSQNRKFVGVMMDIDRFKAINDGFGHTEGDRALKTVAKILKEASAGGEWLFRFAGDEFIVLKLSDVPSGLDDYMKEVIGRIEEFNAAAHAYELSISYGISFFSEGNADTFMKEMDERMYQMKEIHHREKEEASSEAMFTID